MHNPLGVLLADAVIEVGGKIQVAHQDREGSVTWRYVLRESLQALQPLLLVNGRTVDVPTVESTFWACEAKRPHSPL